MYKNDNNKSTEFQTSPGKTPLSSPREIDWTPRNINNNQEPCFEEVSVIKGPNKTIKNVSDNIAEKYQKVRIQIRSTSSVSSELSSLVDTSLIKENVKKTDDSEKLVQTEQKKRNEPNTSEKIGFPESSSLSILQSCVDDPSILCNCRKKLYSGLSSNYDKKAACEHLHCYETTPNLCSSNVKNKVVETQCFQSKENSEAISVYSSQVESDSDAYSIHGRRVEGRKVAFIEYACKHKIPNDTQNDQIESHKNVVLHRQNLR